MLHGHSKSDARHLHLHQVALEKLRREPALKTGVLELLERWLDDDRLRCSRSWLEEWRTMLLTWPFDRLTQVVLDAERGQSLRQCSPLAGVLTPQERWKAIEEVNERLERAEEEPSV